MSIKLKTSEISKDHLKKLKITSCTNEIISVFDVNRENIFIPFNFARTLGLATPPKQIPLTTSKAFIGTLRPLQQNVKQLSIKSLNETGSIVISAEPGFGKTITTIDLICTIDKPAVIFVKQSMIQDQWVKAIATHAPTKKVFIITTTKPIQPDADIYIMNPIILKKDIKETRFTFSDFERIKLLVVDELHQIVTKILHRAFFKFQPDYVIGISATPYRPLLDPFGPVIAWFFGTNVAGTKLFRKHKVYCVKTGFIPETRTQLHSGKLDWSSVLTSQAQDPARNKLIVDLIMKFPERTWLILVKRVEHAKTLQTLFEEKGVPSSTITGSDREFDKSSKILIGTTPKIGVGFDHTPIDALCMAADVLEYFEQFLGRCMRRQDVEPIIIDFEDKFHPLVKHFKSRIQKYKEHGGEFVSFTKPLSSTEVTTKESTKESTEESTKESTEPKFQIKLPKRFLKKK
jgi:superfamily II DNA or RNA helicase